jgi:hypothetical protein
MKGFDRLYERLTPDERFRASLEAAARGDWAEVRNLDDTCSLDAMRMPSPAYYERLLGIEHLALIHGIAARNGLLRICSVALRNASDVDHEGAHALTGDLRALQEAWLQFCDELRISPEHVNYTAHAEVARLLDAAGGVAVNTELRENHLKNLREHWRTRLSRIAGLQ